MRITGYGHAAFLIETEGRRVILDPYRSPDSGGYEPIHEPADVVVVSHENDRYHSHLGQIGPRGITVNNVQPGPIDTDMNPAEGEFAESFQKLMALPRHGSAEEVAAMVAYLAGPEAGFVTGASLMIDGGFSA
jgi:Enoyl-(Acyl carrier protein) reductase/Beta-lactamase superfamily domain